MGKNNKLKVSKRGIEPALPLPCASVLIITPQLTFDLPYQLISGIQNNDSRTFRPLAVMTVENAKINAYGSRHISRQ